MEYMLAIDQGTSGSKAIIFSSAGAIMGSHTCPLRSYYPDAGFVEQDGTEIINSVISAVKAVIEEFTRKGFRKDAVVAAGISNQRESFLLWDASGIPLTPVIVWQCKRSVGICARLRDNGIEPILNNTTGLRIDPYFSGTKLLWLIENNKALGAKIKRGEVFFGTIDTWLVYQLTGHTSFVTDYSNASRTLLMDLDRCAWDPRMKSLFGASELRLPEIRPSTGFFGASAFGSVFDRPIPITALIGDSHAACFGEGCFSPGTVKATMGTGSSVVMNTGKRTLSKHGMVSTVCWSMDGRIDYALEGVIVSCASTVNWIQENLRLVSDPKEFDALAESVPDSGGITFIPAFGGLGGPYWQMDRKAEILGISFGTRAPHIVRAALESYPFQLKDVISAMEKDRGMSLQWIKADGGLTHSKPSMQMIANLIQAEVRIDKRRQASALGAALLGFIGSGALSFSDVAQLADTAPYDRYKPAPLDKNLQSSYNLWTQRISKE
jgi:glycerol kinase